MKRRVGKRDPRSAWIAAALAGRPAVLSFFLTPNKFLAGEAVGRTLR
jgi:hypothetical protein